jgi:Cof subfamily protein (haloacid dehalogenase superfamily)
MSKNSKFNLVCIDVDGTLINDDKVISKFTFDELQRVHKNFEVTIILVSARMPKSLHLLMKELGIKGPTIAYNGGLVLKDHSLDEESNIIESITLPVELPKAVFEMLRELETGLHFGVFFDDNWFVREIDYWALREIRGTRVYPEVALIGVLLEELISQKQGLHKFVIRGEKQAIDEVEGLLKIKFNEQCNIFRTTKTYLEITPYGASKANSIKLIQQFLSISNRHTLAFGDNLNDMEMLNYVGHGVSMDNAPQDIKTVCKETTLSNNEDGIGYILQKYFPF